MAQTETCVHCGAPIPEGLQVCPQCMDSGDGSGDVGSYGVCISLRGKSIRIANKTDCPSCLLCDHGIVLTTDPPIYKCKLTGAYHNADFNCKEVKWQNN